MRQRILLLIAIIALVEGYDSISNEKEIVHYYQLNSQYPIIHVFYNRSFPKSNQFSAFLQVIETFDHRNHDYAKILLTNCDEIAQGKTRSCEILRRTKDNHMIIGYQPSEKFLNYGGKKMQSPPTEKQFLHRLKIYQVQEIQDFAKALMPNFYEQIDSLQQYEKWLQPYYSANLIFATKDDQLPQVLIKLGVHYFLRFDLAFVSDLSDEITKRLNITSFPALLVVTFNFTNSQHQIHQYPHSDFSASQYHKIKQFLEPFALKQRRNDVLFHKIKMPTQQQIVTTKTAGQLAEVLDQANRWSLLSLYHDRPVKLEALKEKYGNFFQYYHLQDDNYQEQTLQMFDRSYDMLSNDIEDMGFLTLEHREFVRNISLWLSKDFVVMGVREKYSHFCSLQLSTLFRGLIHCMAIFDDDYQEVTKSLNLQFDIGFVCAENYVNGTRKIHWQDFKSPNFQTVYQTVQYTTNQKTKQIINQFLRKPINQIQSTVKLSQLCSFPTKKCALLMTHPNKKSKTAFEYLSEVAKDFILQYSFFQIDLSCNPQFNDEIETLKLDPRGLFVYHPRKYSYIYQKTKISKVAFKKFLKTSLKESENNPLQQIRNKGILVHSCSGGKQESDSL